MSEMKESIHASTAQTLYTEIDMLWDTRMGALQLVDERSAVALLKCGYRNRAHDFFDMLLPSIDMKQYNKIYETRDWKVLALSKYTRMYYETIAETKVLARRRLTSQYKRPCKVFVNIFPYNLTLTEQDVLGQSLVDQMAVGTEVEIINISPRDLTPQFVYNNIAKLDMYDFDTWINIHHEEIMKKPMPRVTIRTPARFIDRNHRRDKLIEVDGELRCPFADMEKAMIELLDLIYADMELVSVFDPSILKVQT